MLYGYNPVLIASSEFELQATVTNMKEGCENNDLSLNTSKTKVLVFERNEVRTVCKFRMGGKILEIRTSEGSEIFRKYV